MDESAIIKRLELMPMRDLFQEIRDLVASAWAEGYNSTKEERFTLNKAGEIFLKRLAVLEDEAWKYRDLCD